MDPIFITLIVGVFIPAIVAYVTKSSANPLIKTGITGILSAAASASAVFITGGIAVFSAVTFKLFASAFAAAIISYKAGWKVVDIDNKVAPDKGIG